MSVKARDKSSLNVRTRLQSSERRCVATPPQLPHLANFTQDRRREPENHEGGGRGGRGAEMGKLTVVAMYSGYLARTSYP